MICDDPSISESIAGSHENENDGSLPSNVHTPSYTDFSSILLTVVVDGCLNSASVGPT